MVPIPSECRESKVKYPAPGVLIPFMKQGLWEKYRFIGQTGVMDCVRQLSCIQFDPQAKRKFGYYVLPVLHGEELIGRVEPVRNRKAGLLEIRGCWLEPAVVGGKEKREAIAGTALRLALMNGCDRISLPW